jgi:hypothetical protein
MSKKLLRICPQYKRPCQEVNEELEKDNKICQYMAVIQQNTPQGIRNMRMYIVEALAIGVSNIDNKTDSMLTGGHKDLPKLYLPGAN